MNHDITHCSGTDVRIEESNEHKSFIKGRILCKKREKCHRYIAYLDLKNYKSHLVSMLIPQSCVDNDYKNFWSEKDYNKKP